MKSLDAQIQANGGKKIIESKSKTFSIAKADLKATSLLESIDEKTINLRLKALFKFSKAFSRCTKYINSNDRNVVGSISYSHFNCKSFVIASVINQIVDLQLRTIENGPTTEIRVNRRKAFEYFDE